MLDPSAVERLGHDIAERLWAARQHDEGILPAAAGTRRGPRWLPYPSEAWSGGASERFSIGTHPVHAVRCGTRYARPPTIFLTWHG
jgi:hypothetical protein